MLERGHTTRRILPIIFLIISFSLQTATASQSARDYKQALAHFEKVLKDPQKKNLRHHWMACVNEFQSILTREPTGPWADDALFMMGRVYAMLYEFSSSRYDRQEAVDSLSRLLRRFPESPHRGEAEETIVRLQQQDSADAGKEKPTWATGAPGQQSLAEVKAIRFWSSPTYARVVIYTESEVPYSHRLIEQEGSSRLVLDCRDARIGSGLKPFVPVEGDLLSDARVVQARPDTVRFTMDVKSIDHFKVFFLPDPFRIVIDVRSVPVKTSSKRRFNGEANKPVSKLPRGALARQLSLGVRKIVIDPGHGGQDFGATGYLKGVFEKNVTLEVAHRLAKTIRERLGCEAILTREDDRFLSLEERTALANKVGADLFISIHTNAHNKMASHGIETYFLNLAVDEEAILVASRENEASARNMSDLKGILKDLMIQAKQDESSRLAAHVQDALVRGLTVKYGKVKDKGVKQAPFYVLLGAGMPCILVEVAFITNPGECRRLNTATYQDALCDAIVNGIEAYMGEIREPAITNSAAYGDFSPKASWASR
jgi:N-acetylmuramoyl-L-alanine amidase